MINKVNPTWSIQQLYQSFVEVYADYPVPFQPSPEQFNVRLQKLNLNVELSGIHLEGERITGFLLHTINLFQGKKTAYNGGTGVVPSARGHGIIDRLFDESLPKLYRAGAERVLLEVVEGNKPAIGLYERLGFEYQRTLKSFKSQSLLTKKASRIVLKTAQSIKPELKTFRDYEPCFIDSDHQIMFNWENETLIEAYCENELCGFLIFQPHVGRVSQMGVKRENRKMGVASQLFYYAQTVSERPLTVLNIPESELDTIAALSSLGFKNELNQFELAYQI